MFFSICRSLIPALTHHSTVPSEITDSFLLCICSRCQALNAINRIYSASPTFINYACIPRIIKKPKSASANSHALACGHWDTQPIFTYGHGNTQTSLASGHWDTQSVSDLRLTLFLFHKTCFSSLHERFSTQSFDSVIFIHK